MPGTELHAPLVYQSLMDAGLAKAQKYVIQYRKMRLIGQFVVLPLANHPVDQGNKCGKRGEL
ncbi:hypothetical protein [Methylobacillus sp.]|uniref:hypothetical protein n=1 Tax=Methylobacillus sp. TaxID=56818 RepID=UPI00257CECD9|nr:hypothetical protein [Methylobacillus sp.]